uniref:Aromatic-L-amino-acid decarboxylase-like n=1 Tax=Nelumbo nucifera TaxID=4432 RepID=A0A822ZGY1_NELNU|nr:TPA_asm: hypothetical protein HUJ06_000905 [Nelumbo nucifera]
MGWPLSLFVLQSKQIYKLGSSHYSSLLLSITSLTAIDPIAPLCAVAKEYGVWVHINAAYAGSACICLEFRHFIDGVEDADSFTSNAHKRFFTTLDCCYLWVKDPSALLRPCQPVVDSEQVIDYKDWQIVLSR